MSPSNVPQIGSHNEEGDGEETIEVEQSDESDSTFGSEGESYTTSLSSSVVDYTYENGRRYHAYREGRYMFPNDETENNRLDLQHHIFSLRLGGELHLAPIGQTPQKILDLGTGTGIWAIDMADAYPSASVLGTDLSPIQPRLVPPNCRFEIDDMEQTFPYSPLASFDVIHIRQLSGAIADWPRLFAQIFEHTKPGGWVESQEIFAHPTSDDGTLTSDAPLMQASAMISEAAEKLGRVMELGTKMRGFMEDAGFVDIEERVFKIPCGPWPKNAKMKELGTYQLLNMLEGAEGFMMALFTRVLGYQKEEVEVLLAGVRRDLNDRSIHTYFKAFVVFGRRPLVGDIA